MPDKYSVEGKVYSRNRPGTGGLKVRIFDKEVGYDGMMMPDHVPHVEGMDSMTGFVFAFGYIKALIAAVAAEG